MNNFSIDGKALGVKIKEKGGGFRLKRSRFDRNPGANNLKKKKELLRDRWLLFL